MELWHQHTTNSYTLERAWPHEKSDTVNMSPSSGRSVSLHLSVSVSARLVAGASVLLVTLVTLV